MWQRELFAADALQMVSSLQIRVKMLSKIKASLGKKGLINALNLPYFAPARAWS